MQVLLQKWGGGGLFSVLWFLHENFLISQNSSPKCKFIEKKMGIFILSSTLFF